MSVFKDLARCISPFRSVGHANSRHQNFSKAANSSSDSEEISCILCKEGVHWRVTRDPGNIRTVHNLSRPDKFFQVLNYLSFPCVYRLLVGKPEGKRPLGRPRRRWVDNIRMDLQEVGCKYMDWIGLAQDRDRWRTLVSAVKNLGVPWNAGNFLNSCKPVSCSRRTLHHGASERASKQSK